jgi:hypothetical protein
VMRKMDPSAGRNPVTAPAVLSQTFPALHWRSLAQHYSAHRIEMQIAPSISARHDVVDGTGKLNPRRS